MNWQLVQGQWDQLKGRVKEHWGLLIADFDLLLDGRRDQQRGRQLQRHGRVRQRAEQKFKDLCGRC